MFYLLKYFCLKVSKISNFLQVKDGTAAVSFQLADLNLHLQRNQNQTLSSIWHKGLQIYLGVFVTNIQSKF